MYVYILPLGACRLPNPFPSMTQHTPVSQRPAIRIDSPKVWQRTDWFDPSKLTKRIDALTPKHLVQMSARERKQQEIMGSEYVGSVGCGEIGGSVVSEGSPYAPCTPRSHRRTQSPLIAATQTWVSCPTSCPPSPSVSAGDHRRQTSELIPATMPWTASLGIASAAEDGQTKIFYGRRKVPDHLPPLLPATMPWVTPGGPTQPKPPQSSDFRRRRGFAEELHPELLVGQPAFAESIAVISKFHLSGLPPAATPESVRSLFPGVHIVEVRIDLDILANACRGSAVLTVRTTTGEDGLGLMKALAGKQGNQLQLRVY